MTTQLRHQFVALLCGLLFCFTAYSAFAFLDNDEVTDHWRAHQKESTVEIDHRSWGGLLEKYLVSKDGINLFDYGGVGDEDKAVLESYLGMMQSITVTELNPLEQQSFWINLYNALTIRVILDHYPIKSIRDISFELFSRGPWGKELVRVEGVDLSLDNIEHDILRAIFKDERIHYAVNCASISCPNLQTEPFTRSNLEDLLELGARQYINHSRGVSVVSGRLVISSIYDWYQQDFGGDDAGVIAHLQKYARADLAQGMEGIKRVSKYDYDWSLNEQS